MLLLDLHILLENHLDTLSSPRSSNATTLAVLNGLEKILARASADEDYNHAFLALQLTFQCNMASRILPYIARSTTSLQVLTNGGVIHPSNRTEVQAMTANLFIALCLLQGVALNHPESKIFLGRSHALHILLDLLLTSRHLPVTSVPKTEPPKPPPKPPLTSTVIDTLLCVLVDAPISLRTFEESDGLPAVVKILKRAGTPREVRMKCLEFLYFYLLDETTAQPGLGSGNDLKGNEPKRCVSGPAASSKHRRSSSVTNKPTQAISTPFTKRRVFTPPLSSSTPDRRPHTPFGKTQASTLQNLLILNRPVDYVPLSPKKPRRSASTTEELKDDDIDDYVEPEVDDEDEDEGYDTGNTVVARTTEEKKELLGRLLGNVDALVEGVNKAGILGLG